MARKYANILTAIWRNEDFRALTAEEQRVYLQLNTQPDISAAGVLHLSVTRWSAQARNTTPGTVMAALEGLARGRFVIFDTRTEEVLVRSFIRWDGGYTNSKRKPVIRDAVQEVESPAIRRALAAELRRLGLPDWLPDALPDSPSDTTPALVPDEEPREIASGLSAQENRLSDTPSDALSVAVSASERVVVVQGELLDPQPTTHIPQPSPSVPPASGETPTPTQRSKVITDAYYAAEPMCKWPAVNGVVIKAIKTGKWTDEEIQDALLRMASEGRGVTVESLRIELDGLTPRASPRSRLVEHNGMHLKPETMADIERTARFEAMGTNPLAIGGPT